MRPASPSTADRPEPDGPIPEAALAAIEAHLRERERRREELYHRARRLRRLAQSTMARTHSSGRPPPELAEVRSALAELSQALRADGRADEPLALDALQEAVEACLLGAIVDGGPVPTPSALGVDPEPYLLGLGDVVGEVRRLVVDCLGREALADAERYLALMGRLTEVLLRFDTARAIVQLKPKQDQARGLLERTRGELAMARLLLRATPRDRERP